MKTKLFSIASLVIIMILIISSCKKEDKDDAKPIIPTTTPTTNKIIGLWNYDSSIAEMWFNDTLSYIDTVYYDSTTVEYLATGEYNLINPNLNHTGTWARINNDSMTIDSSGVKIITLTGSNFVIRGTDETGYYKIIITDYLSK